MTLTDLAIKYGTDKWGSHFYTPHYENHFSKMKDGPIKLLEIGVGGYTDPNVGGESLRMWKDYFVNGQIYSIDIYDKSKFNEERITIFKGSQVDKEFLYSVLPADLDIIIDDGSHMNDHVIESFNILFPLLKYGGIYIIEDTQTSYWENYKGETSITTMNYFKGLVDGLNHKEFISPGYEPDYFENNIVSMHFYHNLIFIYKGKNDEESNVVKNNKIF